MHSIHRGNRNRGIWRRPVHFSPLSMHARLHSRWHESSKTARRILHSIREKIYVYSQNRHISWVQKKFLSIFELSSLVVAYSKMYGRYYICFGLIVLC